MSIHFILNRELKQCEAAPGLPFLDTLRDELGLTAAKAGCREGDCGACAVLLGQWDEAGQLRYRSVNTCLLPLGALEGAHVLTVEGLGENINPVQQALVEEGGIQCGFCTPGMVIALTAHLLTSPRLDAEHLLEALDGNLCRCTGYLGIQRAGERLHGLLGELPLEPGARLAALMAAGILPPWLGEIPARLAALPRRVSHAEPEEGEPVLAGGTDLLLQRPARLCAHEPWFAAARPEWHGIRVAEGRVSLGATTTLQELLESQELVRVLPEMHRALGHVASTPVRDRATVGGNLVNASPIGDMSILLLALDAELLLRHHGRERRLPLKDFFLGYKKLALAEGEMLVAVEFQLPKGGFHFEKVAHRDHLDIASVNCALVLELEDRVVRRLRLSAGGVAPIPLRLSKVEETLIGLELYASRAVAAASLAAASVEPLDDVRGSARYKRLLLRQLVLASFLALAPHLDPAEVGEFL